MSSISVVIPTIGRYSIRRTLESILGQTRKQDEVVVVGDGPCKFKHNFFQDFGPQVRYYELPFRTWDWGGVPRNIGIRHSKNEYIAFMDDDDIYLKKAFNAMHQAIDRHKGRAFLFRMQHRDKIIWDTQELKVGNVSTQMILMPNNKERIPFWESNYEADFKFISDLADLQPAHAPIMWMPAVISCLEEHRMSS